MMACKDLFKKSPLEKPHLNTTVQKALDSKKSLADGERLILPYIMRFVFDKTF
jgi:hypothetical protein